MAQKGWKLPDNMKNHTFLDLWVIGSPKILLKLFIKLRPGLVQVIKPYFIKQLGVGVQKCSKILKNEFFRPIYKSKKYFPNFLSFLVSIAHPYFIFCLYSPPQVKCIIYTTQGTICAIVAMTNWWLVITNRKAVFGPFFRIFEHFWTPISNCFTKYGLITCTRPGINFTNNLSKILGLPMTHQSRKVWFFIFSGNFHTFWAIFENFWTFLNPYTQLFYEIWLNNLP